MFISKLIINNYKSIENMSLEFVKGKNLIVGQNNCGKSNIISAINLVIGEKYPPKRYDDKFYYSTAKSFYIVLELSSCDEFDAEYISGYNKKTGLYTMTAENIKMNFFENSDNLDEAGYTCLWKDNIYILNLIKTAKHIYISLFSEKGEDAVYSLSIESTDNKYYKFKFFTQELITSFITSSIIQSERNVKNDLVVSNYSWYGKLIKKVWDNMDEENQNKLVENNKSLSNVTNSIFNNLTDELGRSVKEAIPYKSIEFKLIQDTKTDYYKGIKILMDDGYYSLLEDKGSGIKSLIIIELFKLYCKKYHKYSSCLIVEEPEVFLHPQARSVLSKKIDDFLLDGKNQTIITTHSEQFLSNFDIKQLTFISKENNNSKKYKILENDFIKNDFEKINIITKTENAEMYFADSVILVEGGEKYILKRLVELYKGNIFLDYNNVSLIKVGGKSFFGIYKKMLEKLGKKVYVFGDYDNLKDEVYEYLEETHKGILNQIKGSNHELKKYDDLDDKSRTNIEKIIQFLKSKNIFILSKGALEDYYNKNVVDKIKNENRISGKEIVAHYISTILNENNVNEVLDLNSDFLESILTICNRISPLSEEETENEQER